jgi:hypothetical protein
MVIAESAMLNVGGKYGSLIQSMTKPRSGPGDRKQPVREITGRAAQQQAQGDRPRPVAPGPDHMSRHSSMLWAVASRPWDDQCGFVGQYDGLNSIPQAELAEYPTDVNLHGASG